jgi:SAM-dependent methyltransferase
MDKVDYNVHQHDNYVVGRRMSSEALGTWMEAFARHLPDTRPLVWLDLGSGAGRVTPALANTFGGPALGVEPADKMRDQALAQGVHPNVTYSAGSAEHIPLADASCDAALMFFVWHHVADRHRAANELRRVVKPGGKVFVQANFVDRMADIWWFRVVPEWRKFDPAPFESEGEVTSTLVDAGWTLQSHEEVRWPRSASLAEDLERLRLRSVSLFAHMSEEDVQAGFAKIQAALPSLSDGPQYETSDLLVFER